MVKTSFFDSNIVITISFSLILDYFFCFIFCSYQLQALDKAIRENTIVYLETGSGKTLIAIMLFGSYAHHLQKPSPFIAVFLVPQVMLLSQVCHSLSYGAFCKFERFITGLCVNKICNGSVLS